MSSPSGTGPDADGGVSSASGVVSKSVVAWGSKSPAARSSGDSGSGPGDSRPGDSGPGDSGPAADSVASVATVPKFSAKRFSRRDAAAVTASGGRSVTRPSAVAVPSTVRVVPPSVSRRRSRSASCTEPLPRVSTASPSTA
ncbi:hypothetical protein FHS32_006455 [Streptomyces albaduncus]|uniref:Uncharacterized protein n=1 Tax=Streptomyces griseoloalbus TaxID=67303 RepID=A0A7W8FAX1_9ACTN|nr:hypothetical protein [Streptomyces albaduncus]